MSDFIMDIVARRMSRGPKLEGLSLTMQESNQLIEWTRRGTHRSTVELENGIRDYPATHNKKPLALRSDQERGRHLRQSGPLSHANF